MLVLDLGTFFVKSRLEDSTSDAAKFEFGVHDVMAYLVNEDFSWAIVDEIFHQGPIALKSRSGNSLILPILERMGCQADVTLHRHFGYSLTL